MGWRGRGSGSELVLRFYNDAGIVCFTWITLIRIVKVIVKMVQYSHPGIATTDESSRDSIQCY